MQLQIAIIKSIEPLEPLVVDTGGIIINEKESTTPSSLCSIVIEDNGVADITVRQDGYHTYNMTVDNVYMADKQIVVLMIPIDSNIEDPNYLRPYPFLYTFNDPCSYKVDYYSASSRIGNPSWYVNNTYIGGGSKGVYDFKEVGNYQIKMRSQTHMVTPHNQSIVAWDRQFATIETGNTVSGEVDDINSYLRQDITYNVSVKEYKPEIVIDVTGQTDTDGCYFNDQEVEVFANVQLSEQNNDINNFNIIYEIEYPEGEVLIEEYALALNQPISISLNNLGTHKVTVTVVDIKCNIDFVEKLDVQTCNFIQFSYNCNEYTIYNKGSINVTYKVEEYNPNGNIEILPETTLNYGTSDIISAPDPSLLIVTVIYNEQEKQYVLNNYCGLEDCISEYILNVLCGDPDRCSPCPPSTELNQMLLLSYTYFGKLHREYGYNNFYNGLSDSKLMELASIKDTMDKLLEFCKRRSCESHGTIGNWEPYDYAGRGDNKNYCGCGDKYEQPNYCKSCK